jgi:hypothetical protein
MVVRALHRRAVALQVRALRGATAEAPALVVGARALEDLAKQLEEVLKALQKRRLRVADRERCRLARVAAVAAGGADGRVGAVAAAEPARGSCAGGTARCAIAQRNTQAPARLGRTARGREGQQHENGRPSFAGAHADRLRVFH